MLSQRQHDVILFYGSIVSIVFCESCVLHVATAGYSRLHAASRVISRAMLFVLVMPEFPAAKVIRKRVAGAFFHGGFVGCPVSQMSCTGEDPLARHDTFKVNYFLTIEYRSLRALLVPMSCMSRSRSSTARGGL